MDYLDQLEMSVSERDTLIREILGENEGARILEEIDERIANGE